MDFLENDLNSISRSILNEASYSSMHYFGVRDKSEGIIIKNSLEYVLKKKISVVEVDEADLSGDRVIHLVPVDKVKVYLKVSY